MCARRSYCGEGREQTSSGNGAAAACDIKRKRERSKDVHVRQLYIATPPLSRTTKVDGLCVKPPASVERTLRNLGSFPARRLETVGSSVEVSIEPARCARLSALKFRRVQKSSSGRDLPLTYRRISARPL